jgi:dephospho-CoA kinase
MKRVAEFGNAGAGKSTVVRRLSELAGLPLHVIDLMVWQDGKAVPQAQFERGHAGLLLHVHWIIDG